MAPVLPDMDAADAQRIHTATMQVLRDVGVVFHDPEALEIFKTHGFRVDGRTVYFTEEQVMAAVGRSPARFTLHARNPARDVIVGDGTPVLLPDQGCPFVVDADGTRRRAVLADYHRICKLVHTSTVLDANTCVMVMPSDRPPLAANLEMALADICLTDKAINTPMLRTSRMG